MDNPYVSIIILNYNTFYLTSQCIFSIYTHSQDFDFEVILVDNASSECEADLFLEKFPQIILIKSPENVGFAKGNNLGIKYAKGEFILLLNSDAYLKENSIKKATQRYSQLSDCGLLGVQLISPNGNIQHSAQRFPSLKLELIELFRLQKVFGSQWASEHLLGSYFDHKSERQVDWVWGTCVLFDKKTLQRFPDRKLSDRFFMYGEDMEWGMQMKQLGLRVWYSPITSIVHLMAGSAVNSSRAFAMRENERVLLNLWYGRMKTRLIYLIRSIKHLSRLRISAFKEAQTAFTMLWR